MKKPAYQNYSVLMSVYKKERPEFLQKSMESIYKQTVPTDDFVLICDGPLTDGLDEIIVKMQKKFGKRLKVLRQAKNCGLGHALNLGVEECKNELIVRMDTDDVSEEDRVEKQMRIFNNDVDVVGSNITEYDELMRNVFGVRKVPEQDFEIKKYAKKRNPINHMTVCFRKSKVLEAGNYQNMPGFEDYYLWVRMMQKGAKFYNVQDSLVKVRGGTAMISRRGGQAYTKQIIKFEKELLKLEYISKREYLKNIVTRTSSALLPNFIRNDIYRYVLRRKAL